MTGGAQNVYRSPRAPKGKWHLIALDHAACGRFFHDDVESRPRAEVSESDVCWLCKRRTDGPM